MRTSLIALAAAAALVSGIAHAEPVSYSIDPTHTFVTFEISHFGATVNRARSKSACVRAGASSEVSGIAVVEIGVMAVGLADGDDTEGSVGFDVNDQHDLCVQQANANHAFIKPERCD